MGDVMDGEATAAQLAALLMGLRMRGETVDELAGFATAMRERVVRVEAPDGTIDVVGTGGDGSQTFNISTASALVVAAAGVPVAKHGNRAITSKAGSADVLDALGIRIDHDAASAGAALQRDRLRVPVRADLPSGDAPRRPDPPRDRRADGVQPARPADQPGRHAPTAARRRRRRARQAGSPRSSIDSARSGRSSSTAPASTSCRSTAPACSTTSPRPGSSSGPSMPPPSGCARPPTSKLAGGDAAENARFVEAVLRGEPGSRRDVVVLNAGAALHRGRCRRDHRGRPRASGPHHRRGARDRPARPPPRGAAGRGRDEPRPRRSTAGSPVVTTIAAPATDRNVVEEIAARRRARHRARVRGATAGCRCAARGRPGPPVVRRAVPPGRAAPHRRGEAVVAVGRTHRPAKASTSSQQARAYEAGGAAAISVLCEPHWFGGSVDDLRRVRAAVGIPVLAKEFVVDPRQLAAVRARRRRCRAAARRPPSREATAARARGRALDLGLEPLVEAHDRRELDVGARERRAASSASTIATCARSVVDTERADRLRALVPDDRIVIAESGVRDAGDGRALARARVRWRARRRGADALVGSCGRPPLVRGRRAPARRSGERGRRPFVKVCGITDADGRARGRPGRCRCHRAQRRAGHAAGPRARARRRAWPRLAREIAPTDRRPAIVLVTADAEPDQPRGDRPRPSTRTPSSSTAPKSDVGGRRRRDDAPGTRSTCRQRPLDRGHRSRPCACPCVPRRRCRAPPPRHRRRAASGRDRDPADAAAAAAIAREVPVTLAGGLTPANVAGALREIPAVGVDVASGVERPASAGERPTKDPFLVGLFVKRAKAARDDRPNVPFGAHPGPRRACSRRTRRVAGGWSATSAAGTCPRR